MLAPLNVAIDDATVAAWAATYQYNRSRSGAMSHTRTAARPTQPTPLSVKGYEYLHG